MRVFSVPLSAPFLRTVISALVDGRLVDGFEARAQPERLAAATLYLPTRRAGRLAHSIFLDVLGRDAAILPCIVALGDIDEDELAFSEDSEPGGIAPLDVPPKLGDLERRLVLARLVAAWAKRPVLSPLVVGGPASTLALAGDLARLMDDMVTRRVDWSALDRLVPDQFDKYWQHSLDFLRIARDFWPAFLAETNRIEPAARRDLLIDAEAERLTRQYDGPVIAAGSTGSMPSTAKFLQAVAGRWCCRASIPTSMTTPGDRSVASRMPKAPSRRRLPPTIRNMRCTCCCRASASSAAMSQSSGSLHRAVARCWHPRRCGRGALPRNGTIG
jgi:ATP-dependent helicase/nuclease subunit B